MRAHQPSSYEPLKKTKVFVCEQHANNISTKLQTFYQEQLFVDIALTSKSDNLKVLAHCNVLSASSDYLRSIICSTLNQACSDVIELGIDGATLKLVIDFMYSGIIELRCDNVERILLAADLLKISTLKAACSDFIGDSIEICVTNCLSIASMAKEQLSAELHKKVFGFALQHFEEVPKNEHFRTLTQDFLCEICEDSVESVFHSLVSWMEYDKGNREKCMTDLLKHVRFSFLKPEFIKANRSSVCKTMEAFELICSCLESHLSPTKWSKLHSERKNANPTEREKLGIVHGPNTDNLKLHTFDPKLKYWFSEDLPPAPTKIENYGAIVIDRKLIIAGGLSSGCETNIVECLDIQTDEWINLHPMRNMRTFAGMAELNGNLYVVGGYADTAWLSSVEKYDFSAREWQEVAPMHFPHSYVKVTILGELLYAVGFDDGNHIECYNPANNKWTQLSEKSKISNYFDIAGVNGHLYAIGGLSEEQASTTTVERYNPTTETWTVISPGLNATFFDLQCASWNNRLIACVGVADSQFEFYIKIEEFNPETNKWKTLASPFSLNFNFTTKSLFILNK